MFSKIDSPYSVNLVSETVLIPQGHGSHTAFVNVKQMLDDYGCTVFVNKLGKADMTHLHTSGPFALGKLLTSRPNVVTAHVIPQSFVGSWKGSKYWYGLASAYFRFFFRHADRVIAVSPKEKEIITKLDSRINVVLFPNPLDTKRFARNEAKRLEYREKHHIPFDRFVILGVAQIQIRKGIVDFFKTAKMNPDMTFVWVGGQPFKQLTSESDLINRLIKDKSANIILPGLISYDAIPAYYSMADALLFPSYQENAPMAIAEAAAAGLPIILRDIPDYQQLYKPDSYFTSTTPSGFSDIVRRLKSNQSLYKQYRDKSLAIAADYSFEATAKKLLALYKSI